MYILVLGNPLYWLRPRPGTNSSQNHCILWPKVSTVQSLLTECHGLPLSTYYYLIIYELSESILPLRILKIWCIRWDLFKCFSVYIDDSNKIKFYPGHFILVMFMSKFHIVDEVIGWVWQLQIAIWQQGRFLKPQSWSVQVIVATSWSGQLWLKNCISHHIDNSIFHSYLIASDSLDKMLVHTIGVKFPV